MAVHVDGRFEARIALTSLWRGDATDRMAECPHATSIDAAFEPWIQFASVQSLEAIEGET